MQYFGKSLPSAALAFLMISPWAVVIAADGKLLYNSNGCATCHGATGQGDGAAAAAMNPKPRSFSSGDFAYDTDGDGIKGSDTDLLNILKNGTAKYGGSPLMPGRADIAEADLKAIIGYIRSLKN